MILASSKLLIVFYVGKDELKYLLNRMQDEYSHFYEMNISLPKNGVREVHISFSSKDYEYFSDIVKSSLAL